MKEKGYSQRRVCGLVDIDPRVFRYRSTRGDDAAIRARLREVASERRRFGYRRLHILLKREGVEINWKRLYRLYKEERLTVRKRGGRKRALGTRAPMAIPQGPNQRWIGFVSDALVDGGRFRGPLHLDDFSREALPPWWTTRWSASVCRRELEQDRAQAGLSRYDRVRYGTE